MNSPSGPSRGGVATGSSSSAAINIPQARGGCCGCNCACNCANCSCRRRIDIVDPNREEYGGEGTPLGVGAQAVTQPTSYDSMGSMGSVKESSDAPAPTTSATAAPQSFDVIRNSYGRQDPARVAECNMERYLNEPDDACPWPDFLEKSVTGDAVNEDCALFGPMEVDGSMRNNVPFNAGERPTLSSFISSLSLHTPSVGMSDAVRGVGGVFEPGHRYLRLN